MIDPLATRFAAAFGSPPALVARAPGRVNLIGEHTDYNGGFVLPAAIRAETRVAARTRRDGEVRLCALDYGGETAAFALGAPFARGGGWPDHMRGMIAKMVAAGYALPGADLAVTGTIPRGAGLSSSASLAVAIGTAMAALAGIEIAPAEMARMAQASECDHVGMRCGIMDQLASAAGVAGHALLIDCRSLDVTPIAVPGDLAILIVHSGIARELTDGGYNIRRAECEAAAAAMGVASLRDADLAMLDTATMAPAVRARARHVITENARVLAAAAALAAGDWRTLGSAMAASHASMRDDFAITLPAIDALAAELAALIGPDGGARMTGGGFGGAVVALCPAARADAVLAGLTYRTPGGAPPLVLREHAGDGAAFA